MVCGGTSHGIKWDPGGSSVTRDNVDVNPSWPAKNPWLEQPFCGRSHYIRPSLHPNFALSQRNPASSVDTRTNRQRQSYAADQDWVVKSKINKQLRRVRK